VDKHNENLVFDHFGALGKLKRRERLTEAAIGGERMASLIIISAPC
jgi:hypothetical protein